VRPSLSDRRLGEDFRAAPRAGLHTAPGSLSRSFSALLVPVNACNTFCSSKERACQGHLSLSIDSVETAGPGKDLPDERSFEGGERPVSSEEGSEGGTGGTEAREHLANERTLLAWIRTGVGLISFGLVVERIGAQVGSVGSSGAFGVALAVLGCLALVMGTVQFLRSRRGIASGNFVPAVAAYMVIVVGSLALAGTFVIYVLLSSVWGG
jgi:putative membrane protein